MKELILTMAVVLAVFWIPCGICGIAWCIKWAIKERRWWREALEQDILEEIVGEEVVYK